ncbi:hypothetical protein [Streptomyces sp. 6-11-2]|uniref:hypothetical protein n=1 Tax=Streptomyces sp. 6-11-2 TaxID=2585753 RepID=UPI00116A61FC|nr:hypothetical protein TNCT6_38740 [Streptomyces sp. 6-11-2]
MDKVADLRVLIAGRRVLAVRIDSDLLDRRKECSALTYSVVDLPGRLEKALLDADVCGVSVGPRGLQVKGPRTTLGSPRA